MKMLVCRKFSFEAAHYLPEHPLCGKLHGHTYIVELKFSVNPKSKEIEIDFNDIKAIEASVKTVLDHRVLNDVIELPTVENISKYIAELVKNHNVAKLKAEQNVRLKKVTVYEGFNNWVELEV